MIKLDDNLLTELGLQSLPAEEKRALLRQIYETLEMRVGTTLARQMTDVQLDEFESFINNNDEAGALRWLEANFPNYKDVVAQEFDVLKGEIMQAAPQIVANAAQQAQAHHQAQISMQQPQQTVQSQMGAPIHSASQQYQPALPPQQEYAQPAAYVAQPQTPSQPQLPYQQPASPVAPQQYYTPAPQQQGVTTTPVLQSQPMGSVQPQQTPQPAATIPAMPQQPQAQQTPQQPTVDPYTGTPTDQQFSQPL